MANQEDDFVKKTGNLLDGFFDSIEKSFNSLKDGITKSAEKKDAEQKDSEKKDTVKKEPEKKLFDGFRNPFEKRAGRFPATRLDRKESVTILCELPGCEKQGMKVDYKDDTLTVSAKKNQPAMDGVTYKDDDRAYGELKRTFRIGKVDRATIKASYKDGVLTVTCTRVTEEAREITIE